MGFFKNTKFNDNLILNNQEIKDKKLVLRSKPIILMIVLTNMCNLNCIMCGRKRISEYETLAYAKVRNILEKLGLYLKKVDWQGGEVFLVPYFKKLFLEILKFKNIEHSIVTNGHLIDKDWIEIFSKIHINLTFSIDSVIKETYESIRIGSNFERVIEVLEDINVNAPNVILHLNAVVMRKNYKELKLFPEFCYKYGIKHLRFDYLRPDVAPEQDVLIDSNIEIKNSIKNYIKDVELKCREYGIWFKYTFKNLLNNKRNGKNLSISSFQRNIRNNSLSCKLPWRKLYIDACIKKGGVRPDCLCNIEIGNIMENDIEEIWNSEKMIEYRKRLINGNVNGWCADNCIRGLVDQNHFEGGIYL